MVGLGDRHNNNILLDKASAEVVHIDLGVVCDRDLLLFLVFAFFGCCVDCLLKAFDMGKVLKTPEIVPFRLTRDTVDGFGVTGTSHTQTYTTHTHTYTHTHYSSKLKPSQKTKQSETCSKVCCDSLPSAVVPTASGRCSSPSSAPRGSFRSANFT